ncbi:MAG: LPS assembly lipoprotein LptE [Planctomycetota bacterium]|nr:LPS assembly lipoprotein LptE [Planctomycetota bacterium]MDA1213339.1 LPS assembly lipoprotein LptE [Planctomycetota bacterium]
MKRNGSIASFNVASLCGLLLLMNLSLVGCGYIVGKEFPSEVCSVYVPVFDSNLFRRGVEFQVTEAVQREIQMRTPYRLVKEANADTRLTGKLVEYRKDLLGESKYDDPRELQLSLVVEVRWEDLRTGEILAEQLIPLSTDALLLTSMSEMAPEVGHSLATSQQDAVARLARQVVNAMESLPGIRE